MGINTALYKSLTFGVSALYTGVAGALGAIAVAVRRARQLHLLARRSPAGRPRGRRRRLDPGRALRRRCSSSSCRTSPSSISKAAPGPIYGVILICFIYLMPIGRRRASCQLRSSSRAGEMAAPTAGRKRHGSHREPLRVAVAAATCAGSRSPRPGRARRRNTIRARPTPRSRSATSMPYSGPASAYGTIGKTIAAYFKKVNAEGGINGRKINFISLRRRLQPAEGGRAGAQAGRAGRGAARLPAARHAVQHRDPEVHERARRCRSSSSRPARPSGATRRTSRGPWAGSRTTRPRAGSTPSTCSRSTRTRKIGILYQNDDYGKDYLKGLKDGLGDKAQDDDRRRSALRGHRPDGRFADRAA